MKDEGGNPQKIGKGIKKFNQYLTDIYLVFTCADTVVGPWRHQRTKPGPALHSAYILAFRDKQKRYNKQVNYYLENGKEQRRFRSG